MRILLVCRGSRLSAEIQKKAGTEHDWSFLDPMQSTDDDAVNRSVRDMDALVHTGEFWTSSSTEREPLDIATRGTFMLMSAAVDAGVKRFVFGSTLNVFKDCPEDVHISETRRPMPGDTMAVMSPYLAELICKEFARDHAITMTCLRLGTLADADALEGETPEADWVDYRDAATAFCLALDRDLSSMLNWNLRYSVFHVVGDHANPRYPRKRERFPGKMLLGLEPKYGFLSDKKA